MQKLEVKSRIVLYKSCRVIQQETKKIVLHFPDFSVISYGFYKIQHLHPRSRRNNFTNRSSDFADRLSGCKLRLQLGLWRHGRRRELNSDKGKARVGRERVEQARVITWGSIPRVGWGGGAAGGCARRCSGRRPQGAPAPACWPAMLCNKQLGRLQRGRGEVEDGSGSKVCDRKVELGS
jgi:hypothetical protein